LPWRSIAAISVPARRDSAETLLHDVIRHRLARADRCIALPQRLLQQERKVGAKSCGDLVTPARRDVTNSFQPCAAQAAGDGILSAECGYRQRLHAVCFLAIHDDAAMDMPIHRPRADRGAGNRRTDGKALPRQRVTYHLHQRGLAAEQMRAAGDVKEQAMRGIQRHQRGEAVAPVGDGAQRLRVGGLVGIEHLYIRTDRAGIGQRQAGLKAEMGRGIIQRGNLQRVVLFGDDNAWKVTRVLF
jgi:hypothetical protein